MLFASFFIILPPWLLMRDYYEQRRRASMTVRPNAIGNTTRYRDCYVVVVVIRCWRRCRCYAGALMLRHALIGYEARVRYVALITWLLRAIIFRC